MVVVPEPAVKGFGSVGARTVDRAVGPAGEQGADEAFCFAVGLGPVGAGSEMADAEQPTRGGMRERDVCGAVVGDQLLDLDAVAAVERDRATQERDRGGGFLVREDFG